MLTLLQHELKYYFKNRIEAIYIYSYFISILVLAPFAMTAQKGMNQALASLTLWVALASAVAIGGSSLFRRDHAQGLLESYQLMPFSLESVVLAKWLAFFLFLLAPILAALPVAGALYGLDQVQILHFGLGLAAGTAALSVIATLAAVIITGLEKAGAVLSLIILPLSIPVLIFGAAYCRDLSSLWQANLIFVIGFAAFLLPVTCIAGAYSIRSSH